MICTIETKREVALLIPYRKEGEVFSFYLQKKDKDSKRLPDMFGFFGGGLEGGEKPEQAMLREIQEELNFTPNGYKFFSRYEHVHSINHVFAIEVDSNFENTVKVSEGEYGKFFSAEEVEKEPKMLSSDKLIIFQLIEHLNGIEEK